MGPAFRIQAVVLAIQTMVLGAQARHQGASLGEFKAFKFFSTSLTLKLSEGNVWVTISKL